MLGKARLKAIFSDAVNAFVFLVALFSGVAQLAGVGNQIGRVLFLGICAACLLVLIIRMTFVYYVKNQADLRKSLDALEVAQKDYVTAIDRIIEQEGPIYAETLVLTVTIGHNDDADTIVEERRTIPRPRVTQRAVRPIVPFPAQGPAGVPAQGAAGIRELDLTATLDDVNGRITVLPLTLSLKPLRVWLVFDPGLTVPFGWRITYRPRGLWAPLRKDGTDRLAWTDRLPAGNGQNSVLTDFTVDCIFPTATRKPKVSELHGFGSCEDPRELGAGGWCIRWRDPNPAGHRYEWDLAQ